MKKDMVFDVPGVEKKKQRLLGAFLIAAVLGLLAHGYSFFHGSFTHDMLNAFYADPVENAWKISLGRFVKPLYQDILRGDFSLPWLIGVLSLLWMGLSLYLILEMFEIESKTCMVLTGGLLVTNLTVTLTAASYLYDLDVNMLGLLLAVTAAYQWNKKPGLSIIGVVCLALSLGCYQAYISVCVFLILVRSIMVFLRDEQEIWRVIQKGLIGCIMLVLGAVLYMLLLGSAQRITGTALEMNTYNGLGGLQALNKQSVLVGVLQAHHDFHTLLVEAWGSMFPGRLVRIIHILIMALCALSCVLYLWERPARIGRLALSVGLCFLIPVAVYLPTVLSNGRAKHLLMLYSIWLTYIAAMLLVNHLRSLRWPKFSVYSSRLMSLLLAVLVWGNIRAANELYLIKDMQYEAAVSYMTRVLYRMEEHEEYVAGETPVILIGSTKLIDPIPETDRYNSLVGANTAYQERLTDFSYDAPYKLIRNILCNPILSCDSETHLMYLARQDVMEMPSYPDKDCMRMIDGIFVVKLS